MRSVVVVLGLLAMLAPVSVYAQVADCSGQADGTLCDDGDPLTSDDACDKEQCVGVPVCPQDGCGVLDDCHKPGVCQPSGCFYEPKADGETCDDGSDLTENDRCQEGECIGDDVCENVVCSALDECHVPGTCVGKNTCTHPPAQDGTPCSVGQCHAGKCTEKAGLELVKKGESLTAFIPDPSGDFVFDFNGNAPSVSVKTLAANVKSNEQDIGSVDQRVDNLLATVINNKNQADTSIGSLTNMDNGLDSRLSALEGRADIIEGDIEQSQLKTGSLDNRVTDLEASTQAIDKALLDKVDFDDHTIHADQIAEILETFTTVHSTTSGLRTDVDKATATANRADKVSAQNADCLSKGMMSDGSKCVAKPIMIGQDDKMDCTTAAMGTLRFSSTLSSVEVCDGSDWKAVGGDLIGRTEATPAESCTEARNAHTKDGVYWVKEGNRIVQRFCFAHARGIRDPEVPGLDFGDGSDGDLVLNGGTHKIEEEFNGYNAWEMKIPNYKSVRLINGARLTANAYDPDKKTGGVIMFKVLEKLEICSTCSVDATGLGWPGGRDKYGRTGYPEGVRNSDGMGPGGGRGGAGGKRHSHGAGGGGGSFGTWGMIGTPDLRRDTSDFSALAGDVYDLDSTWPESITMGSGGGAGGPGHPGNSACQGMPGGAGGGAIHIMAKQLDNKGTIKSDGAPGNPAGNYCRWPGSNPQSGSGGAGSGGAVKVFTTADSFGAISVAGGKQPLWQNWEHRQNREGQRGGAGGSGRVFRMKVPWTCTGVCLHGEDCSLVTESHPGSKLGYFKVVNDQGEISSTFCDTAKSTEKSGINFGDGSTGNRVLDGGSHDIEDLFEGYNPRLGIYPQWKNLELKGNAVLTSKKYDHTKDEGGIVMFKVSEKLTICRDCRITADAKGYSGGPDVQMASGYVANIRNHRGDGPGGGTGGLGGNPTGCGAHGSGAGGGSFIGKGGTGTPDQCRCGHENSAVGGPTYSARASYWTMTPELGSGGGSGGPGHPSRSSCAPGRGGHGGGAVQIAAKEIVGDGIISANGEGGQPQNPTCLWPHDNPQVGSGGAGSGGVVKVFTTSSQSFRVEANGGPQPLRQNWNAHCNGNGQRGGGGGSGYTSVRAGLPQP